MDACSLRNPLRDLERSREVNAKAQSLPQPATFRYRESRFLMALGISSLRPHLVQISTTGCLSGVDHL